MMTRGAATIRPDETVGEAARTMLRLNIIGRIRLAPNGFGI